MISKRGWSFLGRPRLGWSGSSQGLAELRVRTLSPMPHIRFLAHHQAAVGALQRLYPARTPPGQLLPSQTFAGFNSLKSPPYTAGELGHTGVNYRSAGRASIPNHQPARWSTIGGGGVGGR